MFRRGSCLLLFVAVLLAGCRPTALPFACADEIGCVQVAPGDPIKIGALQALSGDSELFGLNQLRCIELILEDRAKELLSHPIEFQVEDSLCSVEGGATAASKVVADPQIVGIVGPTCSGAATAAMKVISEAGMIAVSGSSSAPSLTSVGGEQGSNWRPGFFRTAQNDALVGQAAATFAFQVLGVRKAATIDDGDPYTRGLTDTFERAFTELGGQVVLATAVNKGDTEMRPVLTAVAMSGAELLFFPLFESEGDHIVLQAREVEGLENTTLMGAEGLYLESFIQAVGEAGTGMYFIAPATPQGPAYDAFVSRYETKYNESPTTAYHAHMYDAIDILLNAIETVAVQGADGTLYVGRKALRDALHATSGYQGLTGSLTCDQYGDCGVAKFEIMRLDDPADGMEGLADNVVYTYPPGE